MPGLHSIIHNLFNSTSGGVRYQTFDSIRPQIDTQVSICFELIKMSYNCCLECAYPIYAVLSLMDAPLEYVCLVKACKNFKVSVPEFRTLIKIEDDIPDLPLDLESDPTQALQEPSAGQEPTATPEPARASLLRQRRKQHRHDIANAKAARMAAFLATAEKPMSEQASGDGPDPVEQAVTFARRPVTQRREEAEAAGKIKRPLNEFMLYRMAYLNAVKEMHELDNAGEASVYLGLSWGIEPGSVRDRFADLAAEEVALHRLAFPHYKFMPRRAPVAEE